jgi:hypothetical protein
MSLGERRCGMNSQMIRRTAHDMTNFVMLSGSNKIGQNSRLNLSPERFEAILTRDFRGNMNI